MSASNPSRVISALTLLLLTAATVGAQSSEESAAPMPVAANAPGELVMEAPIEPVSPLRPRTDDDEYRLLAGAHYATGRTLFHRGEMAGALRHYQRAWRWDPRANAVLGDIVALAFSLNRPTEAVRYALLSAEHGDSDALLLRRLALYVTEEGDWHRAAKLYRLWLAHPDTKLSQNRLDKLLVALEIGRLEFLVDNPVGASRALGDFQRSFLRAGAESELGRRIRAALGDDLNATWELCVAAHIEAESLDLAAEALEQIDLPLDAAGRFGYLKAFVAIERGDPLEAWEHLRGYFSAGYVDEGSEPYELLGRILKQLNQSDAIVLELAKLQQQDPNNPALAIALASQLEQQQQDQAAVALYHSVALADSNTADGEVPDELLSVAAQRLIEMHASHGEADELLEVLRKAADQLDDLSVLSDALATIPRQVGLVDRVVERAKQADTTSGRQAMALAQLLLTAKRYEQAGEFFQAAIATDAEQAADFSLTWGLALFAADQFDAAATVFQQALDAKLLDSDDPMFHYYLSMSLEMAGQTDEALRVARAAAEMQPDSAEFAAHIPWILYHADRREEAIAAYEAVIAKFDDQFDSETRLQLRDARSSLSHMATINGDLAAGEEWLAQVLDEFPEDIGAQNDLGYLWADSGKHVSRARAMIQQAVDAEPDNAAYRDSLGWVLFQQGEADAAIRELETAVELSRGADGQIDEADGVILDHLGDAHLRAGNVDHALRYWQLALRDLEKNEPQRADVTRKKIQQHSKE